MKSRKEKGVSLDSSDKIELFLRELKLCKDESASNA